MLCYLGGRDWALHLCWAVTGLTSVSTLSPINKRQRKFPLTAPAACSEASNARLFGFQSLEYHTGERKARLTLPWVAMLLSPSPDSVSPDKGLLLSSYQQVNQSGKSLYVRHCRPSPNNLWWSLSHFTSFFLPLFPRPLTLWVFYSLSCWTDMFVQDSHKLVFVQRNAMTWICRAEKGTLRALYEWQIYIKWIIQLVPTSSLLA